LTAGVGRCLVMPAMMQHERDHARGRWGSRDDHPIFHVNPLSVNGYVKTSSNSLCGTLISSISISFPAQAILKNKQTDK
ncbi:MAG: hypothetical protein ACRC91_18625, partial [Aeromonas sp.]